MAGRGGEGGGQPLEEPQDQDAESLQESPSEEEMGARPSASESEELEESSESSSEELESPGRWESESETTSSRESELLSPKDTRHPASTTKESSEPLNPPYRSPEVQQQEDARAQSPGARTRPEVTVPSGTPSGRGQLQHSMGSSSSVSITGETAQHPGVPQGEPGHSPPEEGPHPSFLDQLQHLSVVEGLEDQRFHPEGSEELSEDNQLVVLDPDHPLMIRFQAALKRFLTRQIDQLQLEIKELYMATKQSQAQRQELGVELYGAQQSLAELQGRLEKSHGLHAQAARDRQVCEDELRIVRHSYEKARQEAEGEHKKITELQAELEKLLLHLLHTQSLEADVRDDINTMRLVVKKAESERRKAEKEKLQQDLHVDRLTTQVNELEEQIALLDAQRLAQAEDTRVLRKAVSEACTEVDAIQVEKQHILNQWGNSLLSMRGRDEAHLVAQEALREMQHRVLSIDGELDGFKKSIVREEVRNEKLASILSRAESEAAVLQKLMAQSVTRYEALQNDFTTYRLALQNTEDALQKTQAEQAAATEMQQEVIRQVQQELELRKQMETRMVETLREQVTSNKMSKAFHQHIKKLEKEKTDLVTHFSKIEGDIAQTTVDIANTSCRLDVQQKALAELDKEVKKVNDFIVNSQSEISRRTTLIERKQSTINHFNKQLERMVSELGGEELGPLEREMKRLNKLIEEHSASLTQAQGNWLRLQQDMVAATHERENHLASMASSQKELHILEQKKLRIENKISMEKKEQKQIERHMRGLDNDLQKLNTLLGQNRSSTEQLQQETFVTQGEFLCLLKESERETIQMQDKLSQLSEEKATLMNNLIETEHQIMLWEKKIQLAKEMRNSVDSETGQTEIRSMKAEIHRMKVRYGHLLKQQESLVRSMEQAVERRDTIAASAQGRSQANSKLLTETDFHNKLLELRRKIKETQKASEENSQTIQELEGTQKGVSDSLVDRQTKLAQLQAELDQLEPGVDSLLALKRQNLLQLVALQTRQKHLQAVKDGRYVFLSRPGALTGPSIEHRRLEKRLDIISNILAQAMEEHPEFWDTLLKVSQALTHRALVPWPS
ncbi:coiled-coil domain-containing protein 40 [Suncus etruscus]|uniref:coiled-coil domain-containing protein 40 n=1 Tax=Suncus etruscus TaxID=109475 RepID=UPI00210FF54A|nr:coiled-coil domain-containing protein 40 [Suncus etruscus]